MPKGLANQHVAPTIQNSESNGGDSHDHEKKINDAYSLLLY